MLHFVERSFGYANRVVIEAEDKGCDRQNISRRQAVEHGGIIAGFVKALAHIGKIRRVDRLHTDEYPATSGSVDEVNQLFITKKIGADLRGPEHLRVGCDYVAEKGFRAFDVDGEVVIDEKDGDLAVLTTARGPSA